MGVKDSPLKPTLTKRNIEHYPGYMTETPFPTPAPIKKLNSEDLDPNISTLYYENGNIKYEGHLNKDGKPDGHGVLFNEDFNSYPKIIGNFKNGNAHGDNIECYDLYKNRHSYVEYSGAMFRGLRNGTGKKMNHLGNVIYEGDFENGKYHGAGKEYFPNGVLKYNGSFHKGSYHGNGISYNNDSSKLKEGKFDRGKLDGPNGKIYKDNEVYQKGDFFNGKLEGDGTEMWLDGSICRAGQWKHGQPDMGNIIYYYKGFIEGPDGSMDQQIAYIGGVYFDLEGNAISQEKFVIDHAKDFEKKQEKRGRNCVNRTGNGQGHNGTVHGDENSSVDNESRLAASDVGNIRNNIRRNFETTSFHDSIGIFSNNQNRADNSDNIEGPYNYNNNRYSSIGDNKTPQADGQQSGNITSGNLLRSNAEFVEVKVSEDKGCDTYDLLQEFEQDEDIFHEDQIGGSTTVSSGLQGKIKIEESEIDSNINMDMLKKSNKTSVNKTLAGYFERLFNEKISKVRKRGMTSNDFSESDEECKREKARQAVQNQDVDKDILRDVDFIIDKVRKIKDSLEECEDISKIKGLLERINKIDL